MEKLLEEKLNSTEQTVVEHEQNQYTHTYQSEDNKKHNQSSHILPHVFKDNDSKISMVLIPVDSEDHPKEDTTQAKLSSIRQPKTKGWAPTLATKPPTLTPKEVSSPYLCMSPQCDRKLQLCPLLI